MDDGLPRLAYDPDKYRRAQDNFDALRAIILLFSEKSAFFRITEPVTPRISRELTGTAGIIGSNRDRAVCALANKACNTHAAIRLLTDAGHGDDAMALGRVLLENTVLLQWLLIDPIYRLDLFCISDALFTRRWSDLIQQHFQHKPELVQAVKATVDARVLAVAEFFGNTIHKWAQLLHPNGKMQHVNFEAMMKEVTAQDGSPSTFLHDVVYFLHSAFVHSTASSMRSFRHLRWARNFTLALGPNNMRCDEALAGANTFMLLVLQAVAQYLRFEDIQARLDELFEQMKPTRENVQQDQQIAEIVDDPQ